MCYINLALNSSIRVFSILYRPHIQCMRRWHCGNTLVITLYLYKLKKSNITSPYNSYFIVFIPNKCAFINVQLIILCVGVTNVKNRRRCFIALLKHSIYLYLFVYIILHRFIENYVICVSWIFYLKFYFSCVPIGHFLSSHLPVSGTPQKIWIATLEPEQNR